MNEINKIAMKDLEFHISQMKKQYKWYNKFFKFYYYNISPIIINLFVYAVCVMTVILSVIIENPFLVISLIFISPAFIIIFESEKDLFSNFLFLNRKKYYLNYLDSLKDTECSLESLRTMTKFIEKEKLENIIKNGDGILTYKDIFGKSIEELYKDKELNKINEKKIIIDIEVDQQKKIKKEKALTLLDSLYAEKDNK